MIHWILEYERALATIGTVVFCLCFAAYLVAGIFQGDS